MVDANNPTAIPTSPQGGNVGVLWDPAGGGDHGMLLADPGRSGSFEAYVYISSAVTPVAEQEMWTVGFGTSGTYYNFPDPTTALGFTANGNTERIIASSIIIMLEHACMDVSCAIVHELGFALSTQCTADPVWCSR